MIENYKFKYQTRGKHIFVPNECCAQRGEKLIRFFRNVEFPDYFYHYKSGGHVAALHTHLLQRYFFKIDLKNFFYSIARERVFRALRHWHFRPGGNYARWSCVRNPYPDGPRYVLPIGFVQSPLLASLVLMRSPVADAIQKAKNRGVVISVYLDDFIGSHGDITILREEYAAILSACVAANVIPNEQKLMSPTEAIVAFNCDLRQGRAEVSTARLEEFMQKEHSAASWKGFEHYLVRVESQNIA
jgi:hypothetical protein